MGFRGQVSWTWAPLTLKQVIGVLFDSQTPIIPAHYPCILIIVVFKNLCIIVHIFYIVSHLVVTTLNVLLAFIISKSKQWSVNLLNLQIAHPFSFHSFPFSSCPCQCLLFTFSSSLASNCRRSNHPTVLWICPKGRPPPSPRNRRLQPWLNRRKKGTKWKKEKKSKKEKKDFQPRCPPQQQ